MANLQEQIKEVCNLADKVINNPNSSPKTIAKELSNDNNIFIVSKISPFKSASIVSSTYDFVGSVSLFTTIFPASFILLYVIFSKYLYRNITNIYKNI